jgi:hypothetical protein
MTPQRLAPMPRQTTGSQAMRALVDKSGFPYTLAANDRPTP